jgi:hypothetical protein
MDKGCMRDSDIHGPSCIQITIVCVILPNQLSTKGLGKGAKHSFMHFRPIISL